MLCIGAYYRNLPFRFEWKLSMVSFGSMRIAMPMHYNHAPERIRQQAAL
jgi:hypothetical protein